MTQKIRLSAPLALLLGLALAACSRTGGGDARPVATPKPVAAPSGWVGRERVGDAIELLNRGEAARARKILIAVLDKQPGDPIARSLVKQIDTDPQTLLGTRNFSYTLRPDDTLSALAQRFLGDPMLFYALARYNGIAAPGTIEPGRTIQIPGHAKPAPSPREAKPAERKPAPPVAAAPKPAPPAHDPVRARKLRGAALEQMNRGAINRAVSLLNQALAADPGNALVQRDLDRALRIQKTVHARR